MQPPLNKQLALSTIIVNWNTRDITRMCLESVYKQLGDFEAEVFVVDNASTDGSAEMVAETFPNVQLIRNTGNRGFAAANNQAIQESQGRCILLLNSDTVIRGDVLQQSVSYLDAHPEVGVFGCRVLNPDFTVQRTCFQFPTLLNLILLTSGLSDVAWPKFFGRQQMRHWKRDDERDVDVVTGCYLMVRREAMCEVGLLDESFFFCGEETDWCRRFKKAGWSVRFAPVGEIIHIGNASGRQRRHERDVWLTEGLIRYHKKHGGVIAATCAWLILLLFNVSRFIGWEVLSLLMRKEQWKERRNHFRNIVRDFRLVWPRNTVVQR